MPYKGHKAKSKSPRRVQNLRDIVENRSSSAFGYFLPRQSSGLGVNDDGLTRSKKKKLPKITHIRANAFDSAAFDGAHEVAYTWGSFGQLRLWSEVDGSRDVQKVPKQVNLTLMKKRSKLQRANDAVFN